MRVVLVGPAAARARLRQALPSSLEVIAEAATLERAREFAADAILMSSNGGSALASDEAVEEPLTPREIQVLELLAEGLPNKAIAARLGISDQTVKFHVSAIYGKLGAANRTDAVRRAARRGLITL